MDLQVKPERAIFLGITPPQTAEVELNYQWAEFIELAATAGAEEAGRVIQSRKNPDPAYFLGSGKAASLAEMVRETVADLVISLQELSPVQVRNLMELTGVRVIDRTNLILDIFAQRAQTKEGKLQVELAQLNYALPRLGLAGKQLSRLGGGIGTRGPGETKLEIDRRQVRQRIQDLRRQLVKVGAERQIQRQLREKQQVPTIALVGYTNAGKSTLFNRLTNANTSAANRLFDTLDPLSRQFDLPNKQHVICLDTVGFVSDLPHQLVAAFKSTLEETVRANLLIKVLDATAVEPQKQYQAIQQVLKELGIPDKTTVTVLNKIDLLESVNTIKRLTNEWGALPVSAKTGEGMVELIAAISSGLTPKQAIYQLLIPFDQAGLVDQLHRQTRILEEGYTNEGIRLRLELEAALAQKYQRFLVVEAP